MSTYDTTKWSFCHLCIRPIPSSPERSLCLPPQHFYYEISCQEMYIRYLYKLRDLHVGANNFIEAGFTLKLHADQLEWSDDRLPAELRHRSDFGPLETHRALKEALYNKIIGYFDRGNVSAGNATGTGAIELHVFGIRQTRKC